MWTRGRRRNNVPHWHRRSQQQCIWCDPSTRSSNSLNACYISTSSFNFTMVRWFPLTFINRRALTRSEYQTMENILINGRAHLPLEMRDGWTFKWTKGSLCVCEAPWCAGQLALRRLFLLPKVTFYVLSRLRWLGECFWPPASTTLQYEEAVGNFVLRPAFIVLP